MHHDQASLCLSSQPLHHFPFISWHPGIKGKAALEYHCSVTTGSWASTEQVSVSLSYPPQLWQLMLPRRFSALLFSVLTVFRRPDPYCSIKKKKKSFQISFEVVIIFSLFSALHNILSLCFKGSLLMTAVLFWLVVFFPKYFYFNYLLNWHFNRQQFVLRES